MSLLTRLFGGSETAEIGRHQQLVNQINQLEPELETKTDAQLKTASLELKEKLTQAAAEIIRQTSDIPDQPDRNKARKHQLNELLTPELAYAFALVREAAKRTIGLRHFDVQLVGGIVLHYGQIAEMKTGEGKTLVASLPLYLNALAGLGAQLVTVNDYLARLHAGWMAPVYHFLGLSTGVIGPQFSYRYDPNGELAESDWRLQRFQPVERFQAYGADITYGTNNEFGFDYLRDNMAQNVTQLAQRDLTYAIVDEVDSILIDEARTPLIISAPSSQSAELYQQFAAYMPKLKSEVDFTIDEKARSASLTDEGIHKLERLIGVTNLYDPAHVRLVHHLDEALKAYALYKKNRDYVVKDGEVVIVDEFTGRMLQGRRYSGGLHQAIEAKEGVAVKEESVTLATITFQNYFRLYIKLAGMTGTAATEAEELAKIYGLEVVSIPTHRPSTRVDRPDVIYKTEAAKFQAVVELVKERQAVGQPVLIGTVSIAKSEKLARLLKAAGVKHTVLNAKQHQKEGEVVAQAGRPGVVTVATNMAGRGVDIVLGGANPTEGSSKTEVEQWERDHQTVLGLGGLFVIGTERHESRRIDNQLRGRAGRQGDPGTSQFFISMEDDLMRIFGGDRMKGLMERLNIPDDVAINNKLLSRAIEQAQSRVEGHNFDIRKQVLEYDDVMNKHREAIYQRRENILRLTKETGSGFHQELFNLMTDDQRKAFAEKAKAWPPELLTDIEKAVALRAIDTLWIEHLRTMDDLRESIGLRGYGQREPIVEYKQEAFSLFHQLQAAIDAQITDMLTHVEVNLQQPVVQPEPEKKIVLSGPDQDTQPNPSTTNQKIGRNDPCPCGAIDPASGKVYKYKKCGLINAPYHRG